MKAEKKVRADAKLKVLPPERQAAIAEHALGHKLSETVVWLRGDGLATSSAALSEFLSWYRLREQFAADEGTTAGLIEQLKREVPGLTEEQLEELGQRTFSLLAIRRQDLGGWVRMRAEARMREGLRLEQEKFRRETCELFLKWAEDGRAREIAASGSSNAEKIERLGELMFGADWK